MSDSDLLARLRAFEGVETGRPVVAPDAVNEAMIRHWCVALGDGNPVYTDAEVAAWSVHGGIVAPPTMLQTWGMAPGPRPAASGRGDRGVMDLLDEAGFTSVVATNCEQEYVRYLRPGDRLTLTSAVESISEEKATALGVGHFVTTIQRYHDAAGELVGTMRFRILKFRPGSAPAAGVAPAREPRKRPRPALTPDNSFWFEGARRHELLIQRCAECGRLRHPPRPVCPECRSLHWDVVTASGRGTVYSFAVVHHPQVSVFDYPLPVVLVELEEGTRLVSNLLEVEPADVRIGMPVEVTFVEFADDLVLPQFRPRP